MKDRSPGHRSSSSPRVTIALVLLAMGVARQASAEVVAPPWLRQAAAAPLTPAQSSAPAVVLLDDGSVSVTSDGVITTRHVYAAKIGTREGRGAAALSEIYLTDTGRVRQARGWVIRPSGDVQELDKTNVFDMALAVNDVYNEARARVVNAGEPEPGMVFGAEIVSEERSVFTQLSWHLQGRWPVKMVRRSLLVPPGWRVTSTTFNHAAIEPTVANGSYVWQLADLPEVADEPASPPDSSLVPRLAVSYFPAQPSASLQGFTEWSDVSHWLATISDPQAAADPALAAKARDLTAQAGSEFERIRAIGAYVQHVRYISVQIGLGRGGGYRPQPAAQVFAKNHGDCKDKANLMRAMLAVVGIRAFLVSAYVGDRDYVRQEWPSPHQFNHYILAAVLSEKPPAGTVIVESQSHGRLLFVDPTAEHSRIGTLPAVEEGSLALLIAADGGALVRLPDSPTSAHRVERAIEATVSADGLLAATVRETSWGDAADAERSMGADLAAPDYQGRLERIVGRQIPAARVSDVVRRETGDAVEVSMRVTAAGYGQLMQDRLLVLKPPFSATTDLPLLSGASRTQPVMIEAGERVVSMRVDAPAGFDIDELPESTSLDSPFGHYNLSARQDAGRVVVERRLVLQRNTVPPADYAAIRAFIDKVRAADTAPVVFRRR